jgi:CDP-6-deoxy-D-xylo-4-hexulose-3-dehydrase
MRIPLASSGLRKIDIEIAIKVLKSGNLTMGAEVKKFESKMATYLNVKHFIMVNSGSSANLIMVEALLRPTKSKPKIDTGDGVLVPAIAWPTTIWPLIQLGLKPIFVDIDPATLAIDLTAAQETINSAKIPIKAIFPIHPLGFALPPSKLNNFAKKNKLILINDVCESLGSWSEGQHGGTSGLAGSFSFYFSHHITTMEGGGVATDNSDFADDLRSIRSHGWSRDRLDVAMWNKKVSSNDSKFLFVSTGYNVRPMEIQAAIGTSQIQKVDFFVKKRRQIAQSVSLALDGTNLSVIGLETLFKKQISESNSWMMIPILVTGKNSSKRKQVILEKLNDLEIETRPVLTGNFLSQPAIKRILGSSVKPKDFKGASYISDNAFLVGAHHDLTLSQVKYLCKSLRSVSIM